MTLEFLSSSPTQKSLRCFVSTGVWGNWPIVVTIDGLSLLSIKAQKDPNFV